MPPLSLSLLSVVLISFNPVCNNFLWLVLRARVIDPSSLQHRPPFRLEASSSLWIISLLNSTMSLLRLTFEATTSCFVKTR